MRAPSLVTLDCLIGRSVTAALPALTVGIGIGFARLESVPRAFDAVMAMTLAAWVVYAAFLVLRHEAGWHGRRAAYVALAGFALVIAVRLGAAVVTHV